MEGFILKKGLLDLLARNGKVEIVRTSPPMQFSYYVEKSTGMRIRTNTAEAFLQSNPMTRKALPYEGGYVNKDLLTVAPHA